jgi:MarR family transcriptional regulator, 2-MHQ and catechol-resistance regulon repressor
MKAPLPPKDSPVGPKLWVILARAHRSLASYVEACIANQGLCLSDFMVLEVLLHKGSMTISEIGDKVLLANASMTSAVDRLERRSFVFRASSDRDRRVRMVHLTDRGRTFISDLYARHVNDIEAVTSALSAREQIQLRALLKKLGRSAENASKLRTKSARATAKADPIHTEGRSQ